MAAIAGQTVWIEVVLVDSDTGAPITTALDSDFSASIDHVSGNGILTAATVGAWSHRANGRYRASIENVLAGSYSGVVMYDGENGIEPFAWAIDVLPAAADPAAIADALSTVQDTLENASGGHGIELSIMTSGPSRYRQG